MAILLFGKSFHTNVEGRNLESIVGVRSKCCEGMVYIHDDPREANVNGSITLYCGDCHGELSEDEIEEGETA